MTTLTEEETIRLWKIVVEESKKPILMPGEKTKTQLCGIFNVSKRVMDFTLQRLLAENKITRRAVVINGHRTYVYLVRVDSAG